MAMMNNCDVARGELWKNMVLQRQMIIQANGNIDAYKHWDLTWCFYIA